MKKNISPQVAPKGTFIIPNLIKDGKWKSYFGIRVQSLIGFVSFSLAGGGAVLGSPFLFTLLNLSRGANLPLCLLKQILSHHIVSLGHKH